MILLAVDQSTDTGSVAVLNGKSILAEHSWSDTRLRNQQLFDVIVELLCQTGLSLDAVDSYAVGLGPGSYTGLRTSIVSVRMFSMPDHRPIYGVSSAEVLAWSVMEQSSCHSVMVVGDARRKQLWIRRFHRQMDITSAATSWQLIKPEEFQAYCNSPSVCVTSDWERIGDQLKRFVSGQVTLVEKKRCPSASALGKLAERKIRLRIPSEPLTPIYLHSAVASG